MDSEIWNETYKRSVKAGFKVIEKTSGILLGFNTNIDAIKIVDNTLLRTLIGEKTTTDSSMTPKDKTIYTVQDLLTGLLQCMERGIGEEWQIMEPSVYDWLNKTLHPDNFAIGGQSGIMANVSMKLGVRKVILNAPVVPKVLAELLEKEILIPKLVDNTLKLFSPQEIAVESKELVHWIFEFKKGFKVITGKKSFVVPESRRFIATYDPINSEVTIDPGFIEAGKHYAKKFKGAVLGGHHLLKTNKSSEYYLKKAVVTRNIIEMWKSENPNFLIKYEVGHFSSIKAAETFKRVVLGCVDIIGINELELYQLTGINIDISSISLKKRVKLLLNALLELKEAVKPKIGIHLHSMALDMFYLHNTDSILRSEDLENIKTSLSLAALLTSITALTGEVPSKKELLGYTKTHEKSLFYTDTTKKMFDLVAESIEAHNGKKDEIVALGYTSFEKGILFVVPIKYVAQPVKSVGLGDTCSITQFLSYPR